MAEVARLDIIVRSAEAVKDTKAAEDALKNLAATAEKSTKTLDDAMRRASGSVRLLQKGLGILGVGLTLGSAVKTMSEFENAMAHVQMNAHATTAEMKLLSEEARKIGATTTDSASEAAASMSALADAGFRTNEIMHATQTALLLAAVGAQDVTSASKGLVQVLKSFNITARESGEVGDILALVSRDAGTSIGSLLHTLKSVAPAATATNQSLGDMAAALGVMSSKGRDGMRGGMALTRVLLSLSQGGKHMKDVLKTMNLELADVSPKTHTIVEIMQKFADAGLDATTAAKLWGTQMAANVLVLTNNAAGLKKLADDTKKAAGTLLEMDIIIDDTIHGALEEFGGIIQELVLSLGEGGLTGAMKGAIHEINGIMRALLGVLDPAAEGADHFYMMADAVKVLSAAFVGMGVAAVVGHMGSLIGVIYKGVTALKAMLAGQLALNAAMRANPIGILLGLLSSLAAAYFFLKDKTNDAEEATKTLQGATRDLVSIQNEANGASAERKKQLLGEADAIVEAAEKGVQAQLAAVNETERQAKLQLDNFKKMYGDLEAIAEDTNLSALQKGLMLNPQVVGQFAPLVKKYEEAQAAAAGLRAELKKLNEQRVVTKDVVTNAPEPPAEKPQGLDNQTLSVTKALEFQLEQLHRASELEREIAAKLKEAGDIKIDSAAGAHIAELVTQLREEAYLADKAAIAEQNLSRGRGTALQAVEQLNPTTAALNEEIKVYERELAAATITQEEYNKLMTEASDRQAALNPYQAAAISNVRQLTEAQALLDGQLAVYNAKLEDGTLKQDEFNRLVRASEAAFNSTNPAIAEAVANLNRLNPVQAELSDKIKTYDAALVAATISQGEYNRLVREATEAHEAQNPMQAEATAIINAQKTQTEQLADAMVRLNELKDAGVLVGDDYTEAVERTTYAIGQQGHGFTQAGRLADGFADSFTDAVGSMLKGTASFGDVMANLASSIADVILQIMILEPLKKALAEGFSGGGGGGGGGGWMGLIQMGIGAMTGGAAKGAAFTVGGSGGTDSQMVAFKATPGESVVVQTPNQTSGGAGSMAATQEAPVVNVAPPTVVVVDDPKKVASAIQDGSTDSAIMSALQRNQNSVRRLLG